MDTPTAAMATPLMKKLRALAPNFAPVLDDTSRSLPCVVELFMLTLLLAVLPSLYVGGDGKRGWRSATMPRVGEVSRVMPMMRVTGVGLEGQKTQPKMIPCRRSEVKYKSASRLMLHPVSRHVQPDGEMLLWDFAALIQEHIYCISTTQKWH